MRFILFGNKKESFNEITNFSHCAAFVASYFINVVIDGNNVNDNNNDNKLQSLYVAIIDSHPVHTGGAKLRVATDGLTEDWQPISGKRPLPPPPNIQSHSFSPRPHRWPLPPAGALPGPGPLPRPASAAGGAGGAAPPGGGREPAPEAAAQPITGW